MAIMSLLAGVDYSLDVLFYEMFVFIYNYNLPDVVRCISTKQTLLSFMLILVAVQAQEMREND